MSGRRTSSAKSPAALPVRLVGLVDSTGGEVHDSEMLFRQFGLRTLASKSSIHFVVGWREGDPALAVASDDNGSVVVVDGYIYSPRGSGAEQSISKAADLVLRLIREKGIRSLADVDCDAAFVYWDAVQESLILWRSQIPPVFHTNLGDSFVWSTSLRPLLLLGARRDLDPLAIDAYLSTGWLPPARTPFTHISEVPSRSLVTARNGRVEVSSMWRPEFRPKQSLSTQQVVDGLETRLSSSVGARVAGHDRVAVLLSSGVDSSLITALASKQNTKVEAYTYRYLDYEGPMNEGEQARELTEHLGIAHAEIPYSPSWLAEHLEELVTAYEVPFTYGLHSARLDPLRERGHEVVLTGMGVDGWYPSPKTALVHRAADYPSWLMATLERLISPDFMNRMRLTRRAHTLAALATEPLAKVFYEDPAQTILRDEIRSELYSDPDLALRGREAFIQAIEDRLRLVEDESRRDQDAYLNMAFSVPEHMLMWGYRWASHAGLSLRAPFSGLDMVRYLTRLERRQGGKADLRRLAMRFMPEEIAYRPKFYQAIPLGDWFRGPLREILSSYLVDQRLDDIGVFDAVAVRKCLKDHMAGRSDHTWELWTALCLVIWKDKFVDGTPILLSSK